MSVIRSFSGSDSWRQVACVTHSPPARSGTRTHSYALRDTQGDHALARVVRPTDAQDNTLEVCAKTQGERHCQNFRRLRRAEVTSSLRSQNTNFFSGSLRSPGFILPNLTKLIHLFGFWVGVLINSLNMGSGSALQNIRAESLG